MVLHSISGLTPTNSPITGQAAKRLENLVTLRYPLVTLAEAAPRPQQKTAPRRGAEAAVPAKADRDRADALRQALCAVIDERTRQNGRAPGTTCGELAQRSQQSQQPTHAHIPRSGRVDKRDLSDALAPYGTRSAKRAQSEAAESFRDLQAGSSRRGHRTDNPIDQASAALPNRRGEQQRVQRQAALPYDHVADALSVVAATNAWLGTKLAFRFLVLTAARSGEVRGATWAEIDADHALWTIPPTRMKAGDEHRVPLSDAAIAVLSEAEAIADDSGLLFPASGASP